MVTTSQDCEKLLEAEKDHEKDAPLECPKGMSPRQHCYFSSMRLISDFWHIQVYLIRQEKYVVFKNTNFLAGFLFFFLIYFIYLAALSLHCYATQASLVADSVPLSPQGSQALYLSELNTFYSHKQVDPQQFMRWGTWEAALLCFHA